jgi:hypothetical protein
MSKKDDKWIVWVAGVPIVIGFIAVLAVHALGLV